MTTTRLRNWFSENLLLIMLWIFGGALAVTLTGLIYFSINYQTVCPNGYTMIGDVDSNVGVGPALGGSNSGGVAVVVSSSDNRTCIKVDGDQISETAPIRVRKP